MTPPALQRLRAAALHRRAFVLGAGATAASCAWAPEQARVGTEPTGVARFEVAEPEASHLVLDPRRVPKHFNEAPELRALVAAGRLPPVEQRIGLDPIVFEPLRETGRYGGTLRRAFVGPGDFQNPTRFCTGPDSLLYWDHAWRDVVPNIAKSFEMSRDGRELVLKLRRGMRWSDGAPFTAEDIMFWYEDFYLDRRIVPRPTASMQIDGKPVRIEKIDNETVRYVSPEPYSALLEILAGYTDLGGISVAGRSGMGGYAPKHYFSRFHPTYVSEEQATAHAREAGYANWAVFLKARNDWVYNPDLPVLMPWRVVSPINHQEFVLERNPFSIWVDTEGNQLPYINSVHHTLCANPDAVNFKAASGQLDFQDRHLAIGKLPYLLHNRDRSHYDVHLDPCEGADVAIRVNHAYKVDPEIGDLLRITDFRRALSMAVDRDAILETLMLGTGSPSAVAPKSGGRYYPGDDWARRWAVRDLDRANALLDRIGLTARDPQGYRLRRDGSRLRLVCAVVVAHFDYPSCAEMVRDQWRPIGVDLDVQVIEPNLLTQRALSGELQLSILAVPSEDPFVFPDLMFPYTAFGIGASMGVEYAQWFQSRGANGREPPAYIKDIMMLWRQGIKASRPERDEIGRDIIRHCIDSVLSIGVVSGGFAQYGIHIVNRNLGNVPKRFVSTQILRAPANTMPMTFFFRQQGST